MALKDLMARAPAPEPARPEPAFQPQPPPVAAAPRPAPAPPGQANHIGPTCTLTGEVRCTESLRIDGKVKGEIHCEETLTIGESGAVHARIDGDIVVIAGVVEGDINARRKITLEKTARVTGDLCTPGIVIQEGATLEGRIMIGGGPEAEAPRPRAEAARALEAPKPAPRAPSTAPPSP